MPGKLITVEGLDGAGKTTHLAHVRGILERCGAEVVATREPGGTPLGEALREIVLDPAQRLAPGTEALLIFAARHEHLRRVIEPALAAGKWVLCDRYTDASFAYQAGGSGVVWEKIEVLERWVQADSQPDLTLYFDVEPAIAKQRMRAIKGPDRFEQEEGAFQERVRAAYLRRAREHRARFRIIDANRSPAEVQKELEEVLVIYCSSVGKQSGARS